jgi:hypothetical protein
VKFVPLQDVALVDVQERVDDFPAIIDVGLAESKAVGGGGGGAATVTAAVAVADLPFPKQVIE